MNRIMRNSLIALLISAFFVALSGCGLFDDEVCPSVGIDGILVKVLDSQSGEGLQEFYVVAREGVFIDSMYVSNLGTSEVGLVPERPGAYRVTVGSPGYNIWQLEGVRVVKAGCNVETVLLEARLEPQN